MLPKKEIVMASVIFKPRGRGVSVLADIDELSLERLDDFMPTPTNVDRAVNLLARLGFKIEAQTPVGISFSGPRALFEQEFRTRILPRRVRIPIGDNTSREVFFYRSTAPLINDRLQPLAEAIHLAVPAISFHSASAPVPTCSYLDVMTDVPALLGVPHLAHPIQLQPPGAGIRISMIDTGFINRVTESRLAKTAFRVSVEHEILAVQGVWLDSDPYHAGTNYWIGGSFAGRTIVLGTPLASPLGHVEVAYSCYHPHYTANGYTIDGVLAVGDHDPYADEEGHGTAEAANIFALAPGATVSFVKANRQGYGSYPVAGFQAALQQQKPDIISCSWGLFERSQDLELAIAHAVASGTVVVFSAGNRGTTDDPHAEKMSVSHPMAISVGGAFPAPAGEITASNVASSFDSHGDMYPPRHVPDVVGLVGEVPRGILIRLPTEPWSLIDENYGSHGTGMPWDVYPNRDTTSIDDGWCVISGTSAAAPQAAGICALVLERYASLKLTPMAVKNILENTAIDVTSGMSSTGQSAAPGWDPATGFGLMNVQAALTYLQPDAFCPFIRDTINDNGIAPVTAGGVLDSPDIILLREPLSRIYNQQRVLGHIAKHLDPSNSRRDDSVFYVYLRVQNRGMLTGTATASVYYATFDSLDTNAIWRGGTQIDIPALRPGELRVVGPARVPDGGHSGLYAVLVTLQSPGCPAPPITSDYMQIQTVVRAYSTVACKALY